MHSRVTSLLAGDADEIGALASGDGEIWRLLLETLLKDRTLSAAPAFVQAALEREPSFERWRQTAGRVASELKSDLFTTSTQAMRRWLPWFYDGVSRTSAPDSRSMLEARFSVLLTTTPEDGASQARALATDARRVLGAGPLLGLILLLAHRRLREEGAHDEALAAVTEAEAMLTAAGDATSAALARRLRGGTLLELGRLTEGLALLDDAMLRSGLRFGGGGAFRIVRHESARARSLAEAADVASGASPDAPEWVRALGVIAATHDDPELWRRFERALDAMMASAESPDDALERVVDQAEQRGMDEVARRATSRSSSNS